MASDDAGRVFGVLVTFQNPTGLARTLQALGRQGRALAVVAVIDNAPSGDSRRLVQGFSEDGLELVYLPSPENLGFPGGIQEGVRWVSRRATDRDWILVLEDGRSVAEALVNLPELVRFAEEMRARDARTACVGLSGARFDATRGRLVRVPDDQLNGPVAVDLISGGHLPMYSVGALREVGPFPAELFFGLEEIEYGMRLRNAGYALYAHGLLWRASVGRTGTATRDVHPSWRLDRPTWRRYYSLRNLIYLLRVSGHVGPALWVTFARGLGKPLVNLPLSPRLAASHLALNVTACRDAWTGRMGRTVEPARTPEIEPVPTT